MKKNVLRVFWIVLIVALLVGCVFYLFVSGIQSDLEARQLAHVRFAKKYTSLERVRDVFTYNGDQRYTIVRGDDEEGRSVLVWLGRHYVRETFEVEGLRRYMIRDQFRLEHPDLKPIRIQYAVYEKEPAWEIYYEQIGPDGQPTSYGYLYYRFRDGSPLTRLERG